MKMVAAHSQSQIIPLLVLFGHASFLEIERGTSFPQEVWETLWIRVGKNLARLGKSGVLVVVHNSSELSTKLSTGFSTGGADIYPRIHRPYYCYNVI